MPGNLSDELGRLGARLGLERQDQLKMIQETLDAWYPEMVRAVTINNGVLRITCVNSSVASEINMRQVELRAKHPEIQRLAISTV